MTIVEPGPTTSRLARAVVDYLTRSPDYPFATLIEVMQRQNEDVLSIEVEPELGQHRQVPILDREPIRIIIPHSDDAAPRVLSSRDDFPFDLVHTNRDREAEGLCLCVWEESWDNLSRTLTGQSLVERIRAWLSRTAHGDVHPAGQALEPLLPAVSHTLVLPAGMPCGPWYVEGASEHKGRWTLLLDTEPSADAKGLPRFAVFALELAPQVHGALRSRPYDLAGLAALVADLGADLPASLAEWLVELDQTACATERHPLLLIAIPMRRAADGSDESVEMWAYTPAETLAELGEALGCTFTHREGQSAITAPALPARPAGDLAAIELQGWRVVRRLDRATARLYAATNRSADAALVAIGAGAIGSNLVSNSVKAGIGTWTIIDQDIVMPHNTVRQTQGDRAVGYAKAMALRVEIDSLLAEAGSADIRADILRSGDQADAISDAVSKADLVIDLSASPAVLGHLSDRDDIRRSASFFFNPDGSDLVILAEDPGRDLRLDEIEAQYFLAAATEPLLFGHFDTARADRLRYANACQDLTRPLPPWQVQTLAGIATGRLISLLDADTSAGLVWRLDPATSAVIPLSLPLAGVQRFKAQEMRVVVSDNVTACMRHLRKAAAPNETGGILVGSFDLTRNILHVLAALPAPADSRQSPTYFIRGAKDLKPVVEMLATRSAGQLHYVGEWHSHPDGAAARPSGDDETVFAHLRTYLEPGGSPFAMMICVADETWFRVGWQDRTLMEGVIAHARIS